MSVKLVGSSSITHSVRRFWSRYGTAYLFVLPTLVLYALFVLYPLAGSFVLSFTEWDGAQPVKEFVGLGNYVKAFQDKVVWLSLGHNVIWMITAILIPVNVGLLLAVLLWSRPRGFLIFRTMFFMPEVLSLAVVGIIWKMIYRPRLGVLHQIGEALGWDFLMEHGSLIAKPSTALIGVMLASFWASVGFRFVIFLAGLQNVDVDLIDAAKVDGANSWQRFRHVIIPQLSHVITLVITLTMIGVFKIFDIVYAMTGGGPGNSTELIGTYTYRKAFAESRVGYGSSLAVLTTILALTLSVIFIRLRERGEA